MNKKNENEIKKINEQKLVEESDNKICNDLFSNDSRIDKSHSSSVVKIGKNKFVSVLRPIIVKDKIETSAPKQEKKQNKCYDLNDFDYDCDFDEFLC